MRKAKDKLLLVAIWLSAIVTVSILLWILGYVIWNGIGEITWEFLAEKPKGESGGILPMFVNTIYMVIIALVIATPVGVCAAIYLVEYAKPGKLVRMIRFATESLSGIPSIIFGLFGMIFFVNVFQMGFSLLAGGITVSMMVLPTIIRTTEEALRSVPVGYREASFGLGASKLRTIIKVVLPSALPGILTAIILSIGRVVGETAAVYMTAGMVPRMPKSLMSSGRTLSVHLYLLAKEGISFEKAYATATILIIIVAFMNLLANKAFARKL